MRFIVFAAALLCALGSWQAPEFVQQYAQRLGGRISELETIVRHFDEDSGRSGYTRQAALQLMGKNSEQLIRDQSTRMEENIFRLERLRKHQEALKGGGVLELLMNSDSSVFGETFSTFRPALPLTFEGITSALVGFVFSYLAMIIMGFGLRQGAGVEA